MALRQKHQYTNLGSIMSGIPKTLIMHIPKSVVHIHASGQPTGVSTKLKKHSLVQTIHLGHVWFIGAKTSPL